MHRMNVVLAVTMCLLAVPATAEEIGIGLSRQELIEHIRSHYRPTVSLTYREAREAMFGDIDNRDGKVRCVYTGVEIATNGIPDSSVMNTEHTWPQSKFHERRPMKADLFHLFPTLSRVNSVRGNLPFQEIPDQRTERWWRSDSGQVQIPAAIQIDEFSESRESGFEPREDHKGNVARAMLYFWVVYGDQDISATWIEPQLTTLAKWHASDPADDNERARCRAIKMFQGNDNPFVLDTTLVGRLAEPIANQRTLQAAYATINSTTARRPRHRFPDFKLEYKPLESEYKGSLFRLSQDYPIEKPDIDDALEQILRIPFDRNDNGKENWKEYLMAVRDYCFEGNLEVEWQGQDNPVRQWYHVPWQHYGEKGREGIHGLTREASAKPRQLHPNQQVTYQTHAVAMYNALGGYTIGRVWRNEFDPDPTHVTFPAGTVVVKVLFTQAKSDEVPYLQDPVIWKAYVQDPRDPTKRTVQNLRLLQMDVMIRDRRADRTGGWVFGTYCYNGALGNENRWHNLVPVGIQWGNDYGVTDAESHKTALQAQKTWFNPKLRETVINRSKDLPPQHLGWGGRLNGPADYFRSSCMSCHATAQFPVVAPQHPDFQPSLDYEPGSREWMVWFRNLDCGESFNPNETSAKKAHSMDFSLQLAISIDNFYLWKSATMGGYFTPVLPGTATLSRIETFRPTSEVPQDLPSKLP